MASISEFLDRVGIEHLTCQPLHQCMTGATMKKSGVVEIRFLTQELSPTDLMSDPRRTAWIIWMDSDRFNRAVAELRLEELPPPEERTCDICGFITTDPEGRHYCSEDNSDD